MSYSLRSQNIQRALYGVVKLTGKNPQDKELVLAIEAFVFAASAVDGSSAVSADLTSPAPSSEDGSGFTPIFDGKTLKGWDGNPTYWRVENGSIVGETNGKPLHKLPYDSGFIVWRGGRAADFELKLDYRISAGGNSGVQYRSTEVTGARWVMSGYQFDLDGPDWWAQGLEHLKLDTPIFERLFAGLGATDVRRVLDVKRWTGQVWEDNGRCFLAMAGQLARVDGAGHKLELARVADAETLAHAITNDWNSLHLIARGNQLTHIVNGQVIAIFIDDDTARRKMEGELGLQIHEDAPMKVEFRRIRLKRL
jgi:hypothetical protein